MPNVNGQAPRVARDLNWVRRENSWIVIDARKPAWAAVNDIGKEIIGLCRGKLTANEIAGKLSDKYGVAMTTTKRDTKTFLTDMEKAGLVSFAPIKRPRIVIGDQPTQEAVLEITSRCNFRCKTCYVERPYNEYDELSWETLSRFIPAFLKTGAQTITLSGGEPLLHPDFRKVFKLALDSGAKEIKVLTNGSLIDDDMAKFLAQDKRVYVQVSLDGARPETNDRIRGAGCYEMARRGLQAMVDAGAASRTLVSMTPTKMSYREAGEVADLAKDLGLCYVHFSRIAKQGRATGQWEDMDISADEGLELHYLLAERRKRYEGQLKFSGIFGSGYVGRISVKGPPSIGCDLGKGIRVRSDGNIYPCPRLEHPEYCLGHIDSYDYEKIAENLKRIRAIFLERIKRIDKCAACGFRYFCGAGCMADALLEEGSVWQPDPRCELKQRFYFHYIEQDINQRMGQRAV